MIIKKLILSTLLIFPSLHASENELPQDSAGFTFDEVIHEDQQFIDRYFDELHEPPKSLKKNHQVFKDLKRIDDQTKIDYHQINLQRKFENAQLSYPKVRTVPFRAMLKKGSAVFSPNDGKYYTTNYDIVFNTRMNTDNSAFVELLDPKGEIKFETAYENIIPMERDLQIKPQPEEFKLYDKSEKMHARDDVFKLYTKVLIHQEVASVSYFKEVFKEKINKIENTRLEVKPMYDIPGFNTYVGFTTGYTQGRISSERERMDYKSLYWGPAIDIRMLQTEHFFMTSGLAFQKSLGFKLNTSSGKQDYKQNIIQLNTDFNFNIKSGTILVGLIYKYIHTTYAGGEAPHLNTSPDRPNYTSIGLSIGYGFNKML